MKLINIDEWERKQHFNFFKNLDSPYFSITANLDITNFYRYIKENNLRFFIPSLYAATKTANDIREFRYRIRGDQVIEHDTVNPSFTVLTDQQLFSICSVPYLSDFQLFLEEAEHVITKAKHEASLTTEPERDDLVYMTCIPWVSFTAVSHPVNLHPADSIPRIAWGKYFGEGDRFKMPLSVQGHHALLDGFHIGQYFELLQRLFDQPDIFL
jgi:chloramphenicol O-acetyltransferase type A